jgi:hypothetical protein
VFLVREVKQYEALFARFYAQTVAPVVFRRAPKSDSGSGSWGSNPCTPANSSNARGSNENERGHQSVLAFLLFSIDPAGPPAGYEFVKKLEAKRQHRHIFGCLAVVIDSGDVSRELT